MLRYHACKTPGCKFKNGFMSDMSCDGFRTVSPEWVTIFGAILPVLWPTIIVAWVGRWYFNRQRTCWKFESAPNLSPEVIAYWQTWDAQHSQVKPSREIAPVELKRLPSKREAEQMRLSNITG